MTFAVFDFEAIRKETKAFADTPPQDAVTAGIKPAESHIHWAEDQAKSDDEFYVYTPVA